MQYLQFINYQEITYMAIFGGNKEEDLPDEPDVNSRIEMGDTVRDRVTGFEGIVTSYHKYLNGCVQWGVEKLGKEDKPVSMAFDDQQLEVVEKATFKRADIDPNKPEQAKPMAAVGGPSGVAPSMRT